MYVDQGEMDSRHFAPALDFLIEFIRSVDKSPEDMTSYDGIDFPEYKKREKATDRLQNLQKGKKCIFSFLSLLIYPGEVEAARSHPQILPAKTGRHHDQTAKMIS